MPLSFAMGACTLRSEVDLHLLPGVPEACQVLRDAGFVDHGDQSPDIARGTISEDIVTLMNSRCNRVVVGRVSYVARYDGCAASQNLPSAERRASGIDRGQVMVGDRWRDTQTAQNAGCFAVFIDYGYREQRPKPPYHRVTSLREAASWIIGQANGEATDA
jgi:phosphoglycolate phosphatase-like HAD superfamily hydrolase